jgi:hypothetical protein
VTTVHLSDLPGVAVRDVAESLYLHSFMLSRWRKQAREGLVMTKGVADGTQPDPEFAVNLGHVHAHRNRAWHLRDHLEQIMDEQWPRFSAFPGDLQPVG